ncbi:MAG: c-type heme family protein [Methylobacter sp.]
MTSRYPIDKRLRRQVLPLILIVVTILMSASLMVRMQGIQAHAYQLAAESARNIFRMITLTRQWNAEHGGVYVIVSENTPSNPYLRAPLKDIELANGSRLTMINPSYMTRQIAELAQNDPQLRIQLHITSLKPIRPENKADEWETHALKQFEEGQGEVIFLENKPDGNQLRYMAPLMVKPACLVCHAEQGYHEGDVRGGISVTLPMATVEASIQNEITANWISYGVAYSLLIAISWGLLELLARRWRALNETIDVLQRTRGELVENEKMASLGRLVAGFAHEINTPIGVAVGAVSLADDTLAKFAELIRQDEVSEQTLNRQISDLKECNALALSNLRRTAELVQRFKRTSIDRSSQQKRAFRFNEVIDDVLTTLRNALKHTAVEIQVNCSIEPEIYGIPGLFEQVLTNLIVNSLTHGFKNGSIAGHIVIDAAISPAKQLLLDYRDDGVGMAEAVRMQAFEPFFTTSREQGGSGLGLYVVYNIVTQQLGGVIHISPTETVGTHFHIACPIDLHSPLSDEDHTR